MELMKRIVMARVLRNGETDDGSFDREFWRRQGHEAIFAAAWEMVEEARMMKDANGGEPRLQRSVSRVVRGAS